MRNALVLLATLSTAGLAHADASGKIHGHVVEESSGKPLAGVTVTVNSPSLPSEQTEFTDANGDYTIDELPPGEYAAHFYFSTVKVEDWCVVLRGRVATVEVNAVMPASKAEARNYRITDRAPTVDTDSWSASDQEQLNAELRDMNRRVCRFGVIAPTEGFAYSGSSSSTSTAVTPLSTRIDHDTSRDLPRTR